MSTIPSGSVIGIVGGGQLGRMSAQAAAALGYQTHIFCPADDSPATLVSNHATIAPYDDVSALETFAKAVDMITFEFENIPHETLEYLTTFTHVRPNPRSLHIAQHRIREKDFLNENGVVTATYQKVDSQHALEQAYATLGEGKALLKTTQFGYDGKGQHLITQTSDLAGLYKEGEWVLEAWVAFDKEISVIVARGVDGEVRSFPVAENVHKNGILDTSMVPADIDVSIAKKAQAIAIKIAEALDIVGLLAVEFFVTPDGNVLVNELAPRPHNSGHWTMDGCATSQFEQFIRAICGLPLGPVDIVSPIMMKNLLGDDVNNGDLLVKENQPAQLHLYGKKEIRPGRKMGHVNFILNKA